MNYSKFSAYFSGIGLMGLALYLASVKDFEGATQSFFAALGVLGLRQSVNKVKATLRVENGSTSGGLTPVRMLASPEPDPPASNRYP